MGIEGLDNILNGGLPPNRLYLVQGDPGVGKTTLAMQFLLEGEKLGQKGLYITLSETKEELLDVAMSHGWDLSGINLMELSAVEDELLAESQNTLFHPSEVELARTTKRILAEVERVKPARVVFDSLSELRLLAETPLRYRRQMLSFKQFFSGRKITVLFLDDLTAGERDLQVQSLAHGVIALEKNTLDYGIERRRIQVVKLRGLKFRSGYHDYIIQYGGVEIFPRLIASEHSKEFKYEPVPSGLRELDILLGGGLDRGTSNLFMGPAGTGKSTLALQYALAMARRGEKSAFFCFDENKATLIARAHVMGMGADLDKFLADGTMVIEQINPTDLPPGQFAFRIRDAVQKDHAKLIVLDSLNGYMNAMPDDKFLNIHAHELLNFLGKQGVLSIMTMTQHGLMGSMNAPVDLSYLADTVVMLRYFEAMGSVKKAISIIKKRTGAHENTIREYYSNTEGIHIGQPLKEFQGVLTGVPTYFGKDGQILNQNVRQPKIS